MLVFFINLISLTEFHVRYLALFCFFSVIKSIEWFLMGSLLQEYPVNAEVTQGSNLDLTIFLL